MCHLFTVQETGFCDKILSQLLNREYHRSIYKIRKLHYLKKKFSINISVPKYFPTRDIKACPLSLFHVFCFFFGYGFHHI